MQECGQEWQTRNACLLLKSCRDLQRRECCACDATAWCVCMCALRVKSAVQCSWCRSSRHRARRQRCWRVQRREEADAAYSFALTLASLMAWRTARSSRISSLPPGMAYARTSRYSRSTCGRTRCRERGVSGGAGARGACGQRTRLLALAAAHVACAAKDLRRLARAVLKDLGGVRLQQRRRPAQLRPRGDRRAARQSQ